MRRWLGQLDRILRGEATQLPALREGRIEVSARGLSIILIILGMIYGLCMGTFALTRGSEGVQQLIASTVKLPALFYLTLIVTFPSLYVFNALMGSRLTLLSLLRLLIASMGVMLAVLASFGTIIAFFSFTTTSYSFMVFLNVAFCAAAGGLGLVFLLQTLQRISVALRQTTPPAPAPEPLAEGSLAEPETPSPLDALEGHVLGRHVKKVFNIWVIVFGLVGAQMSWVLRPFIGDPNQPFSWFRPKGSNFFEAVGTVISNLLGN